MAMRATARPPEVRRVGRRLPALLVSLALMVGGCSSGGEGSAPEDGAPGDETTNPTEITGQVHGPGPVPLAGVPVALLSTVGEGLQPGEIVSVVVSDEEGRFRLDEVPRRGQLLLQAAMPAVMLHAPVTGAQTDISLASEIVVRVVQSSRPERVLPPQALAALVAYGETFVVGEVADPGEALEALSRAMTPSLADLVASFDQTGVGPELSPGRYGLIELEARAGAGEGLRFVPGVGDLRLEPDEGRLTGFFFQPGDGGARGVASQLVTAADGTALLLEADAAGRRPLPGAFDPAAGVLVQPVLLAPEEVSGPAAGGALRLLFASPPEGAVLEGPTRLDPLGAGGTGYHLMRLILQHPAEPDGIWVIGAGAGIARFDSGPQSPRLPVPVEPGSHGGFSLGGGGRWVEVDLAAGVMGRLRPGGAGQLRGWYRVVPGTPFLELQTDEGEGPHAGTGLIRPDGKVVVMETARSLPGGRLEQAWSIALRQLTTEAPPPVSGTYRVAGQAFFVRRDGAGTLEAGVSVQHGTLQLDGAGGSVEGAGLVEHRIGVISAPSEVSPRVPTVAALGTPGGTLLVEPSGAVRLELELERDGRTERVRCVGATDERGDLLVLVADRLEDPEAWQQGILILMRIAE